MGLYQFNVNCELILLFILLLLQKVTFLMHSIILNSLFSRFYCWKEDICFNLRTQVIFSLGESFGWMIDEPEVIYIKNWWNTWGKNNLCREKEMYQQSPLARVSVVSLYEQLGTLSLTLAPLFRFIHSLTFQDVSPSLRCHNEVFLIRWLKTT